MRQAEREVARHRHLFHGNASTYDDLTDFGS
jgi:hypothetical protein